MTDQLADLVPAMMTREKMSTVFERVFGKIKTQFRNDPLSWSVIFGISGFFFIFLVLPLIYVTINAVYFHGRVSLEVFGDVFSDPKFFDPSPSPDEYFIQIFNPEGGGPTVITTSGFDFGIILNTLIIGFATTLLSLFLGILTAFLMARVDFPGKRIISGLLLIPLVLPPFVSGIGFRALFGPEIGLINNKFLIPLFGFELRLEGLVAIILVQSLHYFTLIYLNVFSALMNADPSMEESAENLGADRLTVTRKVTIPLAMPGIISGSILVFILAMEDLGTPIIFAGFGDSVAKSTVTYYISTNIFASPESSEIVQDSAALGVILLISAIIGFVFLRKYVSLREYSMVSKGRAGEFRTFKTGVLSRVVIYLYFMFLLFISTLPHIGIIYKSFTTAGEGKFTLEFYQVIFSSSESSGLAMNLRNTLVYSGVATVLIVILATLAGYVANRKKFYGQGIFDTLVTIPIAIPGIVLGIGFIRMFGSFPTNWGIFTLNPLAFPPTLLIISYTVRKFPFTVRAVFAGLQQTNVVLEEAAENLGASKPRVLSRVIIPLIAMNIVGGALVSMVYTMSEVSTTLILITQPNYGNIVYKLADISTGKIGVFAALGVLLMILQSISLIATNFLLRNRAEALTGI
ncbi:MAG: iron ABC transporter permease [Methanobacteriota archaeon]|nr:MAG: iron ABC transporter permease [Euryarchaeota archaeon]